MPRPVGGAESSPGDTGGHGVTGRPGNMAQSVTRTGAAGRGLLPFRPGYHPSAAGRKKRSL